MANNDALQHEMMAHVPNLRAFARSLAGTLDRADDLVQETLVKAWKNRDRFAEGSNMKAWLFTILRNTFLSERRKRKNEVEDRDGAMAEQLTASGGQAGHMDALDFQRVFHKLPVDQQEALVLVGLEGFSYEDAALMCATAVGTIKSRVSRARAKLADLMGVSGASEFGAPDGPYTSFHPAAA
jgi:RNA polymerase sigma-70 factor (ECF subfamily)